jgi:uncharacterized protein (UPF0332 family)
MTISLKQDYIEYRISNSHAGLKHQFTLHFIKSGIIDKETGRLFVELFDLRQKGDYGDFVLISQFIGITN